MNWIYIIAGNGGSGIGTWKLERDLIAAAESVFDWIENWQPTLLSRVFFSYFDRWDNFSLRAW